MSAPFGKSPKVRAYIEWARSEAGCAIKEGVLGAKSIVRIDGPSGYAFIAAQKDEEVLSHSKVAQLDRRLGVDSPFPKTPLPYR